MGERRRSPILPSTLDAFEAAFGPHGVQRKALRPTYGLAEATVLVSVTTPGEEPTIVDVDAAQLQRGIADQQIAEGGRAVPLVSSAAPPSSSSPSSTPIRASVLCPRGRSARSGRMARTSARATGEEAAETAALFGAHLENAGELPADGWLRTEDLGVLIDGDSSSPGRIKDLIIVDGRNIYPHDIEYSVEQAHEAIAQRRLAAFSVPTDTGEAMVVVAEQYRHAQGGPVTSRRRSAVPRARAVSNEHFRRPLRLRPRRARHRRANVERQDRRKATRPATSRDACGRQAVPGRIGMTDPRIARRRARRVAEERCR